MESTENKVIALTVPKFTLNGMNKTTDGNFSTKVIEHTKKELVIELAGGKMGVEGKDPKQYYKPGTFLTFDAEGVLIAAENEKGVFVETKTATTPAATTERRTGSKETRKDKIL